MPIEILMPALSPTMEEGTLSKWLVAEGDMVRSGDVLAEIETDKATMEVEAVEEGKIAKLLVAGNTEGVKVNAPIAILLEEDEDESALEGFTSGGGAPKAASPDPQTAPEPSPAPKAAPAPAPKSAPAQAANTAPSANAATRIKASPVAKRLAKEAGLDLASVTGSGPNGRIVKADITAAQSAPKPQSEQTRAATPLAAPHQASAASQEVGMPLGGGAEYLTQRGIIAGTYDLEPLDGMRRVIAKRLSDSNVNVPDFPLTVDCEIDALLKMRKELNAQAPEGVKISVNDMLIRASALALKHCPKANASFTPDGIAYHHNADVAVAVAIDGGLITPIVRAADNKGLSTISVEMKDLAGRARSRKLKPQEYQGGTFSISNLGMMGIREFGSIINEPHGMILSIGAGAPRPVVKDGAIAVATVMTVTLTCDHRVVDGALGAEWLGVFKRYVEAPITMML